MKKEKSLQFTIWKKEKGRISPRVYPLFFTKAESIKIIKRILNKDYPYSFDVYDIDDQGWKTLFYEKKTSDAWWV